MRVSYSVHPSGLTSPPAGGRIKEIKEIKEIEEIKEVMETVISHCDSNRQLSQNRLHSTLRFAKKNICVKVLLDSKANTIVVNSRIAVNHKNSTRVHEIGLLLTIPNNKTVTKQRLVSSNKIINSTSPAIFRTLKKNEGSWQVEVGRPTPASSGGFFLLCHDVRCNGVRSRT